MPPSIPTSAWSCWPVESYTRSVSSVGSYATILPSSVLESCVQSNSDRQFRGMASASDGSLPGAGNTDTDVVGAGADAGSDAGFGGT